MTSAVARDDGLYDALVVWLSTVGGGQGHGGGGGSSSSSSGNNDVSDGVLMASALHKVDSAGRIFSPEWLTKIRLDVPAENVRLKAANLKKVMNGIHDYNSDVLGIKFNPEFNMPDINSAAQGNKQHLSRLLQLLLGCAVNCDHKQLYIENIMNMEESVQQLIMQAIQELLDHQVLVNDSSLAQLSSTDVRKLMDDFETANLEREQLKQRCHELENQVNLLQDEKSNMSAEFEQLQAQVGSSGGGQNSGGRDEGSALRQQKDLRRQLETAQEELYKMEKERDEFQLKIEELDKRLEESAAKESEMQKVVEQARSLKDEVDILRETSDKVSKYEATIESYKKKMEEMSDVKRQLKLMEEKYTRLVETNLDLEEDVRKTGNWKPQVDAYKREIADLRQKLDLEANRADKLEFETKNLLEKVEGLSNEKDRLVTERDKLKEANDEMQDTLRLDPAAAAASKGGGPGGLEPDSGMLEMIPASVKERLVRLQHENKRLKASLDNHQSGGDVLQQMVDDLKDREANLESSNRKLNQRILELDAKVEESNAVAAKATAAAAAAATANAASSAAAAAPRVPGSREELELKLAEANKKYASLQETLQRRDQEMQIMEEKYKRYIEKAKSVIKTLDPKQNPGSAPGSGGSGPEMSALRSQLTEKERMIESLEQETEKARAVREMEERLISSAFYNLSMQMHRTAVENRLSNVHSSSSSHGQSFLARQRQVGSSAAAAAAGAANPANPSNAAAAAAAANRGGGDNAFLYYDNRP